MPLFSMLYSPRPSILRLPSVGLQTPDSGLSGPTAPIGLIRLIGPIVLRDLRDLMDLSLSECKSSEKILNHCSESEQNTFEAIFLDFHIL